MCPRNNHYTPRHIWFGELYPLRRMDKPHCLARNSKYARDNLYMCLHSARYPNYKRYLRIHQFDIYDTECCHQGYFPLKFCRLRMVHSQVHCSVPWKHLCMCWIDTPRMRKMLHIQNLFLRWFQTVPIDKLHPHGGGKICSRIQGRMTHNLDSKLLHSPRLLCKLHRKMSTFDFHHTRLFPTGRINTNFH